MKDKKLAPNQAAKDIAAQKNRNRRPDVEALSEEVEALSEEASKETAPRDVLAILEKAYAERIADSRSKRQFRKWVIPWALFCGALPLGLLLASLYFLWPTVINLQESGAYTALIIASSLIFVSIYGFVLVSLRGNVGTSTDEMGVLRALIRRFFGDQSD